MKSQNYNNYTKKKQYCASASNPAAYDNKTPINLNNVQSRLNISFRGASEQDRKSELFGLLKQMNPEKIDDAIDKAKMDDIKKCRSILRYCENCFSPPDFEKTSPETIEHIAETIPEEFEKVALFQDPKEGESGFHEKFNDEILTAIGEASPEVFGKGLLLTNKEERTPVHYAAYNYRNSSPERMDIMGRMAPEAFEKAVTMKDKYGDTPLHITAQKGRQRAADDKMQIIAKRAPEGFKKALFIRNNEDMTPVQVADSGYLYDERDKKIAIMASAAPEETAASMLLTDENGNNSLHGKSARGFMLEKLYEASPEKAREGLLAQNIYGKTPLHYYVDTSETKPYKFAAEKMPETFAKAITIQDGEGKTPLHYMNGERAGIAAKTAPEGFKKGMLIQDNKGKRPLYYYTKNGDIEAVMTFIQTAPAEFKIAASDMYNEKETIFEKLAGTCLEE